MCLTICTSRRRRSRIWRSVAVPSVARGDVRARRLRVRETQRTDDRPDRSRFRGRHRCAKTSLKLHVFNVGTGDLVISSVQRLMGSAGFRVLPNPGTPLVLAAGEDISFTVQFDPTTPGIQENATIRLVSNNPVRRSWT